MRIGSWRRSSPLVAALLVLLPVRGAASGPQLERGREVYGRMCAVCHGPNGEGYRADQAPRLASPEFLSAVSDAYLRRAVAQGRPGTTMSAWATDRGGPLSSPDLDALVAFMRAWDRGPRARLDERPLTGNAVRGQATYDAECARCHGERGVGGPNVHIGSPQFLGGASNGFLRHSIRTGRPGTSMPGFADSLGGAGIEDVVAFLRTFQSPGRAATQAASRPAPLPLGPMPINPQGPPPTGFKSFPAMTSVDTVKRQLDAGARFAMLDARAPSDYAVEHIAGAVSVPFYDPSPYVAGLPKNVWLVCYCACPHAESMELAEKLLAAGFTKVTVLDEGMRVWKQRNYPMRTGDRP